MAQALWVLRLPAKAKILVSPGKVVSGGDKLAKTGKKDYFAPIPGKIVRVGKREIELQFEAKKVNGQGLGKGHCWGKVVIIGDQDFTQLNISHQGKIVFLKQINNLVINKAKTLGIKGLVGLKFEGEVKGDCPLPALLVVDESKLTLAIEGAEGVKCLLDATKGYLLVPKK